MSSRAWLGLAELPPADTDGVLAETTLRDTLLPRVVAMAQALFAKYPPAAQASDLDRGRYARVLAVCAAIDADDAATAVAGLTALEERLGVTG